MERGVRKVEVASQWKKEETGWQNDLIRFLLKQLNTSSTLS
jgi:hypothetical protein